MYFFTNKLILKLYVFFSKFTLRAQSPPGEGTFWKTLSHDFQYRRTGNIEIMLSLITLGLILSGLYGIFWIWKQSHKRREKELTMLEAFQENYKLSEGQEQYLEALIERFKNKYTHDPEVATSYLKQFLEYTVKNLTHAPNQTLRRQVHKIPDIEPDDEILIITRDNGKFETLTSEILRQKERYLTLPLPPQVEKYSLEEDQKIEISYNQRHLTYRGRGKIQAITEDEIILYLPDGLHFEQERVYTRLKVEDIDVELTLQNNSGETIIARGKMHDISVEGAGVKISTEEEINKHLQGTLEFQLPEQKEMETRVEVARVNEHPDGYNLGLKFIQLELTTREHLARFIKEANKNN